MSKETLAYLNAGNIVVGRKAVQPYTWWDCPELQTSGKQIFWDEFVPADAILNGPFGWTALEIEPTVTIPGENGESRTVPMGDYKAIVRNDTGNTLGVFKQGYQPHQPAQLVDLAMDLLTNEVGFTSAGSLRDGAVLWLEASVLREYHNDRAGFGFVPNLLFTTSFNGTLITDAIRTAKYSICDNTHEIARQAKVARVGAKHTKFSLEKLANSHSLLGLIEQDAADLDAEIDRMVAEEITVKQFNKFLDLWAPIPEWKEGDPTNALTIATKKREGILTMWSSDERVTPWKGTVFGAHQLISTWNEHGGRTQEDDVDMLSKRFHRNQLAILSGKSNTIAHEAEKFLQQAMVEAS